MDCGGGCAKALLIIFNFIFWLSGGAILGIGIWIIADKNIGSYFDVLEVESQDDFFKYAAYILIAFGVFVLLVGFCGCCGAIRNSICLLSMYIFFLVIIFCGEIAAGVLMVINRNEIESKVDATLKESIREDYDQNSKTTDAWNIVQVQLECCGGVGPDDYENSAFTNTTASVLPKTCCILTNRDEALNKPDKANPKNATACTQKLDTNFYYTRGCKDGLIDQAKKYTAILIGIGFGIGCLQIFGCVAAIWLCRKVRQEESY